MSQFCHSEEEDYQIGEEEDIACVVPTVSQQHFKHKLLQSRQGLRDLLSGLSASQNGLCYSQKDIKDNHKDEETKTETCVSDEARVHCIGVEGPI